MRLKELRESYLAGRIEKKLYWEIARGNYTHILTDLQSVVKDNPEIESVVIQKNGIVLTKANGVKLYFDFSQSICRAEVDLLLEGDPEKEDMVFINDYLSNIDSRGVIFDIGANVGIFSLDFWLKHNSLEYYLFEPIPMTYRGLINNALLNMGTIPDNYKTHNIGMSDKKGSFDFFVPASNEAASLVANEDSFYRKRADENGVYNGCDDIERVECKVETVDGFIEENGIERVDFIKIDVEGNEKNVLKGAEASLKKYKPLVYCELLRKHAKRFGYHPNEVIEYMSDMGYVCKTMRDGQLVLVKEITEDTIETNFFFEKN